MFFNKKKRVLNKLILNLQDYLEDNDIKNSKELLDNREYYLCFDTLITQLYEYDVEISEDTYNSILENYEKLNFDNEGLMLKIKELIRNDDKVPKTVKEGVRNIINIVKENNK